MINPKDIWKPQRMELSCYSTCLSMLLKNKGIEITDVMIADEVKTPILIEYNSNNNLYNTSFSAYQELIQLYVSRKNGFDYVHKNKDSINEIEYLSIIRNQFNNRNPVIVGVMSCRLPNFHNYNLQHGERHAIVIYKEDDYGFHCLDPSTTICNRKLEQPYDSYAFHVHFPMSESQLQSASVDFELGYIDDTTNLEQCNDFVNQSIDCINSINLNANGYLSDEYTKLQRDPHLLMKFKTKYISPFTEYMKGNINKEYPAPSMYNDILIVLDDLDTDFHKIAPNLTHNNIDPDSIEEMSNKLLNFSNAISNALSRLSV